VKTRIGSGPAADLKQIAGVREHIGPSIELMVDAYWSYSLRSAILLAKRMEEYDVYFFEEPMPQYQLEGYERLCAESPVPIAVGERIYSLPGFELVIRHNAGDLLQPDATVAGGIFECVEIAALARASDRIVIPHIGGLTAVGLAANLHLAAVIDSPMLEYDLGPYQPLRDELLLDPIFSIDRIRDGCLPVPEGPGLGIEIDEAAFDRFPYAPGDVYPDLFPQFGVGKL
jgi:D-galactarolactone cycloisomerase